MLALNLWGFTSPCVSSIPVNPSWCKAGKVCLRFYNHNVTVEILRLFDFVCNHTLHVYIDPWSPVYIACGNVVTRAAAVVMAPAPIQEGSAGVDVLGLS